VTIQALCHQTALASRNFEFRAEILLKNICIQFRISESRENGSMWGIWWKRVRHDVINQWGAITKLIVTTSSEILTATGSTEGKYFKTVFQYLSISMNYIPLNIYHSPVSMLNIT
jgi:hypothetical protein